MSEAARPAERTEVHTRILRVTLAESECRAYWQHVTLDDLALPAEQRVAKAFEERWFGARTIARVRTLMATLSHRFDTTPEALVALRAWRSMPADTRVLVCHWHLQFSDPVYRAFTGEYLARRRADGRATVDRDGVERWVRATWNHAAEAREAREATAAGERWAGTTRLKFAGNLLTAAGDAGLVAGRRNPRALVTPRVPDDALAYLLHLLREARFAGAFLDNPYLASVGLDAAALPPRLASLRGIEVRQLADVVDVEWGAPSLRAWAEQRALSEGRDGREAREGHP